MYHAEFAAAITEFWGETGSKGARDELVREGAGAMVEYLAIDA
jgi:hypothetical protein